MSLCGRTNLFQRTAMHWDALAPYNAAQSMRLTMAVDPDQAAEAWKRTLLELGVGRVKSGRQGRDYCHVPFASPLNLLPAGADLEAYLADEMNRPFDLEIEGPFRAYLLPSSDPSAGPAMGIVYHHWVADSVSVRLLLREWFYRIIPGGTPRLTPFPLLNEPSEGLLQRLRHLPGSLMDLIDWAKRAKKVRRSASEKLRQTQVGHRIVPLPDGTAERLHTAAKGLGVKVTDLLLCSLVQTCHQHFPAVRACQQDLAVGSIRDLRVLTGASNEALGVSLAFGNLICPADVLTEPAKLLAHVTAANAKQRDPSALRASRLDMRLALFLSRLQGKEAMQEFYRKRVPLSGGLSNVDLSRSWVAKHHPSLIAEYFRTSPTGPMVPVVITPTTLGRKFNIAMTWRKSFFGTEGITAFAADLTQHLEGWIAAASARKEPHPATAEVAV